MEDRTSSNGLLRIGLFIQSPNFRGLQLDRLSPGTDDVLASWRPATGGVFAEVACCLAIAEALKRERLELRLSGAKELFTLVTSDLLRWALTSSDELR